VSRRHHVAVAGLVAAIASAACSTLLGAEPTPVPGAAATLTRSINTPIPTPIRTPSPLASPSRVAVAASPSAAAAQRTPTDQPLSDAEVENLQRRLQTILAASDLSGIDTLLLDHVSLSTPDGGSVLSSDEAASWMRDRASPGIKIVQVDRGTQEATLRVQTDGWQKKDPIQQGQVNFALRRYDANGRQDQSGGGEWKIDVIETE
jgi:hypothetical protein